MDPMRFRPASGTTNAFLAIVHPTTGADRIGIIHGDEPLRCGAENRRLSGTPAVRIAIVSLPVAREVPAASIAA
jgi:hypothetical protein